MKIANPLKASYFRKEEQFKAAIGSNNLTSSILIEPLYPLGVKISGLTPDFGPDVIQTVTKELTEKGLVVLVGMEDWTGEEVVSFVEKFMIGERNRMVTFEHVPVGDGSILRDESTSETSRRAAHLDGLPMVRVLGNARNASLYDIGHEWHSDGEEGIFTVLHCKETPREGGGETLFADAHLVYEKLTKAQKELADRLIAVLSNRYTAGGPGAIDAGHGMKMNSNGTRVTQVAQRRKPDWVLGEKRMKLITEHPLSGRKLLVTSPKNLDHLEEIVDPVTGETKILGEEESREIIRDMLDTGVMALDGRAFDPNVVYTLKWKHGVTAMWDNRQNMHSTTPVADYKPRQGPGSTRLMWNMLGFGVGCGSEEGSGPQMESLMKFYGGINEKE